VSLIGLCFLVEMRLNRLDAVSPYPLKPMWGLGEDWLLVSYDEHQGPGGEQHKNGPMVGAGGVDTIMLLHLPHDGGRPMLVSLPPNSYVLLAGYGPGSLSAAFTRGGPTLLVRTLEAATHVSIERYAEIGFGGLAAMVDAAGGVRVCKPTRATKAAPESAAGCPNLSGRQALAYLHTRNGDLDHAERQRKLITALIEKTTSPGVALNPVRSISLATKAAGAVTVDKGDHLYDLIRLALSLRGAVPATVPTVSHGSVPGVGPVVTWDAKTTGELINALVTDGPAPKGLITDLRAPCPRARCASLKGTTHIRDLPARETRFPQRASHPRPVTARA
jgi:LCP family protein required for cell wall assembly